MDQIGIKLRALRELHHYKQEYIGDYLGIGQSAYSRIENGKPENISLGHIIKLAELYKISPEQILGWDGKVNIGTVNGLGVNQATTNKNNAVDERIKYLEARIEHLMSMLFKE